MRKEMQKVLLLFYKMQNVFVSFAIFVVSVGGLQRLCNFYLCRKVYMHSLLLSLFTN